jgi:hypothetical protein
VIERHCGACKVIAGEFTLAPGYPANGISTYAKTLRQAHKHPGVWGFHDYHDPVHRNLEFEKAFSKEMHTQRMMPARLWITESAAEIQHNAENAETRYTALGEGTPKGQTSKQGEAAKEFLELNTGSPSTELALYYMYRGPSEASNQAAEEHKGDSSSIAGFGNRNQAQGLKNRKATAKPAKPTACLRSARKHVRLQQKQNLRRKRRNSPRRSTPTAGPPKFSLK